MKKLLVCLFVLLVLLLFSTVSLFATTNHETGLTKALELMGFIRQYHMVEILPIEENDSGTLGYGMPFNIMGSDVSYQSNKTIGRQIAAWTIASTYAPISIEITATPLEDLAKTVSIDYYLCFRYNYAKFNDNGISTGFNNGYIVVSSDASDIDSDITPMPVKLENESTDGSGQIYPIISRSQDVRFMLFNYSDIEKTNWPYGYYTSTVTIRIIGS